MSRDDLSQAREEERDLFDTQLLRDDIFTKLLLLSISRRFAFTAAPFTLSDGVRSDLLSLVGIPVNLLLSPQKYQGVPFSSIRQNSCISQRPH